MVPKIYAISDLHGHLPEIPPCDLLLIAGDVCPDVDPDGTTYIPHMGKRPRDVGAGHWAPAQLGWIDTVFSEWLLSIPAKTIVGIAGNHDFAFQAYSNFGYELPWCYLADQSTEAFGLNIWGSPWTPRNTRWAFHLPDEEISAIQQTCPEETDIALVHGPPYGLCDFTQPYFGSEHAGFRGTRRALLERVAPSAYICGHIHESRSYGRFRNTLVLNVSHMDKNYKPINPPVEVKLVTRKPDANPPSDMQESGDVEYELRKGTLHDPSAWEPCNP